MKSYRYIDNLPLGWDTISMKDATSLITDYVANGSFEDLAKNVNYLDTPDYAVLIRLLDYRNNFSGPFVYINKDSFEFLSKSELHGGELIIANVGENVGTVFQCPNLPIKMSLAPNAIMVNFKDGNQFYYYWLKSQYGQKLIRSIVSGCAQPKFNKTNFRELIIPHPKFSEQKRIANVLNDIDSKIAMNNKINKELDAMSKELYNYWFIQFDFPNEEGKSYKSSGGKMSFNSIIKRDIPDEWEVKKISSQIKENIGGDWGKEKPEGNYQLKVSCCRGADIISMTDLPTRYILNENSSKLLKEDDIIVEISGGSPTQATGRCVLISKEILNSFDNKLICSNFCQAISILDKDYVSYFYHMWKMFYDSDVYFNFEGKTSGIKNFQYDTFVAEKWYFPPKDLAIKFGEIVSKNYKKKCELELENKRLAALRDELLPMLMNGQVTIK